jgi:hypothetical protein
MANPQDAAYYTVAGVNLHAKMMEYLELPVFHDMAAPELVVREPRRLGLRPARGWADRLARRITICRRHHRDCRPEFSASDVLNTLLHEMAHLKAPPFAGHGPEWKSIYKRACAEAYQTRLTPDQWVDAVLKAHGHDPADFARFLQEGR